MDVLLGIRFPSSQHVQSISWYSPLTYLWDHFQSPATSPHDAKQLFFLCLFCFRSHWRELSQPFASHQPTGCRDQAGLCRSELLAFLIAYTLHSISQHLEEKASDVPKLPSDLIFFPYLALHHAVKISLLYSLFTKLSLTLQFWFCELCTW